MSNQPTAHSTPRVFQISLKSQIRQFLPMGAAILIGLGIAIARNPEPRTIGIALLVGLGILLMCGLIIWLIQLSHAGDSILFDEAKGTLHFRKFRFKTRFLPDPVTPEAIVHLADAFDLKPEYGKAGEIGLNLRTTQGVVFVPAHIEDYAELKAILVTSIAAVRQDYARLQELNRLAPKLQTPWYGWLLLISCIGASFFAIYHFCLR